MSCTHQYDYEGCRSYGANIPGSCQGAYFPGDEPGIRCNLTGNYCQDPEGDCPADCNEQEELERTCPECNEPLYKSGSGTIYCRDCGYID